METVLIYILKSTICLSLFYWGYKALLARETFFSFNRHVLLAGIAFSLLLPCLPIHIESTNNNIIQTPIKEVEKYIASTRINVFEVNQFANNTAIFVEETNVAEEQANPITTVPEAVVEKPMQISWLQILIGLYLFGVVVNIGMLYLAYYKMKMLIELGQQEVYNKLVYVKVNAKISPFSWFKYIVLSNDEEKTDMESIIRHEEAHIEHKHYLDILFLEFVLSIHWFNPLVWMLKQEIKNIHEYQADSKVINSGFEASRYQLLILKEAVGSSSYALANSFNHSKIKKRITMMLKQKSKNWNKLKLLFLVPVSLFAVYAFASTENKATEKLNESSLIVSQNLTENDFFFYYPKYNPANTEGYEGFGLREDPIYRVPRQHLGVDIKGKTGDKIHAAFSGKVTVAENMKGGYGKQILIAHANGLSTRYAHLDEVLVNENQEVKAGDIIGTLGNTGKSTHPHIHFEILENNIALDPALYIDYETKSFKKPLNTTWIKPVEEAKVRKTATTSTCLYKPNTELVNASYGIVYVADEGTEIYAVKDGVVIEATSEPKHGNIIQIKHEEDTISWYAHNKENKVKKGDRVQQGQVIALVGKTGDAKEPYFEFKLMVGSNYINPYIITDPVDEKELSTTTTWKMPVEEADAKRVSGFGNRMNPTTRKTALHTGMDFTAKEGVNIYAARGGAVIDAITDPKYGNIVKIKHERDTVTWYAHNKENKVQKGDIVQQGQVIALVGNTGITTGPHLHFEIRVNDKPINPTVIFPRPKK